MLREPTKFSFHLIALPFLPVTKKYSVDAFQQKIHKLTRMLLDKGHTVYLYGTGYTDLRNPKLIWERCAEMQDIVDTYGDGFDSELGYDISKGTREDLNTSPTKMTLDFHNRVVQRIRAYAKEDHFLLLPMGVYQSSVANAVNLKLTVEPGIGYLGSFAPYRAFESHSLQMFTYGKEHPNSDFHRGKHDRVIPNYFDPDDFDFNDKPDDYLLFIARLNPQKGTLVALRIATELKMKLKVAGQGDASFIKDYPKAEYVGVVGPDERRKLLSHALVTLVPSQYLEAFGGIQIESHLSGTPTVTSDWSCFPETTRNGVSGYRACTIPEYIEATRKALKLDRHKVREWGERYTMDKINDKFQAWWEHLYKLNFIRQNRWYKL